MEDETQAVCGLTTGRFPDAQPEILLQLLQALHDQQEDVIFQADMTQHIQAASKESRSKGSSAPSQSSATNDAA